MVFRFISALFVLACVLMGWFWADYLFEPAAMASDEPMSPLLWQVLGGGIGLAIALLLLYLLHFITQDIYEKIAPAFMTIVLAMVMGYFAATYLLIFWPDAEPTFKFFLTATLVLLFGFAGVTLGLTRASNWDTLISAVEKSQHENDPGYKLVDTSVLIDGRIADICASGFVEGVLLVPRFVLQELQNIADSSDVLRRAKGRRGLDILKDLQEPDSPAPLRIIDDDPRDVSEVDSKLIRVARDYSAKILTTDYNLNKVAQIEGTMVLNINDLANALKPAVLPDERMEVKIIKEGKEPNQGVGYLDDGTMVVVDAGRQFIGKKVEVVVTSVLQTAAGRMIFSRCDAPPLS